MDEHPSPNNWIFSARAVKGLVSVHGPGFQWLLAPEAAHALARHIASAAEAAESYEGLTRGDSGNQYHSRLMRCSHCDHDITLEILESVMADLTHLSAAVDRVVTKVGELEAADNQAAVDELTAKLAAVAPDPVVEPAP